MGFDDGRTSRLHRKARSVGPIGWAYLGDNDIGVTFMSAAHAPQDRPASTAIAEDVMLAAVRGRDASFDGRFVYGVRTTGVFCRPSCASRPARRENLSFHAGPAAAREAGFRACKRCRPEVEADARSEAVTRACRQIEAAEAVPSLEALARTAGFSAFHFHRLFKAATGVTPAAYAASHRARRVAEGLRSSASVTEAIYDAGFNSAGRFYETSTARLGMTPTALRKGGAGAEIRFAVGQCSLGAVLAAATDKGVCAILLGDDPDQLVRDLQDRFPRATLTGADASFEQTVAQVIGLIEAPGRRCALPLDIQGTAFQQQVWEALRAIPAGATASYATIAAAIGRPRSARAVAQACAGNRLAVAIPCHRVVRTDGDLSGYRWGVARKRELLQREAS
jgi:AraC family transcriptional regulator of adaptative response/methylated-DNA-[protein]-cysteine methyltransferase